MAAPPLDSPCDGPVTYPGDIKTLIKSSKGRSEHVQRMDTDRIPKQALQYKPKEHRTTEEEMVGPISLRIKEQETHLILHKHDDDDDDDSLTL